MAVQGSPVGTEHAIWRRRMQRLARKHRLARASVGGRAIEANGDAQLGRLEIAFSKGHRELIRVEYLRGKSVFEARHVCNVWVGVMREMAGTTHSQSGDRPDRAPVGEAGTGARQQDRVMSVAISRAVVHVRPNRHAHVHVQPARPTNGRRAGRNVP